MLWHLSSRRLCTVHRLAECLPVCHFHRQFQTIFFAASAERLDDVSPELLNSLVWSLARLQLAPTDLWWQNLVQAAASVEKSFSHSQLASLIHSVALWAEPGGIAPRDVQVFIDLLLVEADLQLSVMQPAELTTIVWSLGSLAAAAKLHPDWEIQTRLLAAVQSQLPRLNPSQLSSLCWGLAKLDQKLSEGFAEALFMEVQAQMQVDDGCWAACDCTQCGPPCPIACFFACRTCQLVA